MDGNIDWGQVIFLALVVIVGFFRWLGNLIEQQKEARERRSLTQEEQEEREVVWRRQVGETQEEAAPTQRESSDPFGDLRELLEQMQAPEPEPEPPPLPEPEPVYQAPEPPPMPEPVPAPATVAYTPIPQAPMPDVAAAFTEAGSLSATGRRRTARLRRLRAELGTPQSLRKAVLLREILGPPKALQ